MQQLRLRTTLFFCVIARIISSRLPFESHWTRPGRRARIRTLGRSDLVRKRILTTQSADCNALLDRRRTFKHAPSSGPRNSRRTVRFGSSHVWRPPQLPDTLSTVNSPDWRARPETAHFGPASWQSGLLALLTAIFVRPVLGALTVIGMAVNRVSPDLLQRARLDGIDGPMGLIRPLPGTDVTRVDLPHCPAEWVVAPQARESDSLIVYFHGSALVTLGLNSHRRFVSRLSRSPAPKCSTSAIGWRRRPASKRPSPTGWTPTACAVAGVRSRADRAGRRLGGRADGRRCRARGP